MSSYNDTEDPGYKPTAKYIIAGLATEIPIAIAATFGNFLVIWAVYYNKRLRSVTNYYIVSLAIADMLVGFFAIPFALATNAGLPQDNFYACLFTNSFVVALTQSSIFGLLAVALDRYFAVTRPLRYRRVATSRCALMILLSTWVLAFIIGLTPLFGWNMGKPDHGFCIFVEHIDLKYMVYFNFFGFVLPPLVVMLFVYVKIFQVVRIQYAAISRTVVGSQDDMSRRRSRLAVKEGNAAKLLAIVILLFAISWLPLHVMNCISLLWQPVPYEVLLPAIILSHANSAMNPILYAFSNREFRRTFHKLIFRVTLCGIIQVNNCDSGDDYAGMTAGPECNEVSRFTSGYQTVRNGVRSSPPTNMPTSTTSNINRKSAICMQKIDRKRTNGSPKSQTNGQRSSSVDR
ncbi:adenosine receptor A2b-like [Diadema setosum]|uniref:adenosine receptor A2b-like n=1 Tax=Diadema setosum TaxID=31175 RepID=UPI003B3A0E51